ncbi:TPA: TraM recognition domain-containing protein [Vibrio vulnificus]|uniref:type IV secretory system conjugative DNA transfer family protein n=1 Tax=Vibrio parahaemolyticus TaxID=670 RepID=UPI0004DEF350|nr:TraM recognition domain-containing protein [Vibrio parahaemolyticus]HAS6026394.1 TraM recognition domain-containing protein [Vibrio vulnificus]HAS6035767.1 TraM recognition domain-containing protein [Vibrio vulnificus]
MSSFAEKTRYAMQMGLLENKSRHVDARPILLILKDYIPLTIGWIIIALGFLAFFIPELSNIVFCIGIPIFFYGFKRQLDYFISAPMPKDTKKRKAREKNKTKGKRKKLKSSEESHSGFRLKFGDALLMIGYDMLFGTQLWIDLDRETRMSLISGTTGSGKTVTLCSQLFQACIQGHLKGGAPIYLVDGKGSVEGLYDFLFYIWRTGRIHDLRLLNFLTGGEKQDVNAMLDEDMTSNKFNPFSDLNADECRGLVLSFGRSSEGGNNEYFRDRASNMLGGLFPVLTYKRDNQGQHLDITVIQQSLGLRELLRLASDTSIPLDVRKPLQDYLKTLNAIEDAHFSMSSQDVEINTKADEQHTYNKSMVAKTVNEMAGNLGHIFSSVGSDLNTRNVINHGQIAIILLPTIEKDPDSMAELGRMLVGSLRPAFQTAFGFKSQGSKKATVGGLPTQRLVPVRVYLDEVMNYYTKGIASFLSLLRSLKISFTLLGQSLKGLEDAGLSEGRQTVANLNNKYMFSSQDVYETFELLAKSLGKMVVTRLSEMNQNIWGNWVNGDRLQKSEENIVDERDMASADPMEGLYLYRGRPTPFRSATFFPDDDRDGVLDDFYLNQFAELQLPDEADLSRVRSILAFEDECLNDKVEAIDPEQHSNAFISNFVSTLATMHERVCNADYGELYFHQHLLCYSFIDDMVDADLLEVARKQEKLQEEADKEREHLERSQTAQQRARESKQDVVTEENESYWKDLISQHISTIGLDENSMDFSPILDDGSIADDIQEPKENTINEGNFAEPVSSTEQETYPDISNDSDNIDWFVSPEQATDISRTHIPSYGRYVDEEQQSDEDQHDATGQDDSADSKADSESNSEGVLFRSRHLDELAKRSSEITGVSKDQILSDIYNVKIYPTNPTPSPVPQESQSTIVSEVYDEFDEAIQRVKAESDQKHNALLDQFTSGSDFGI